MPTPDGHRRVRCPACEKRYAVRLEDITGVGAEITCPHCAHAFVVFPEDDAVGEDVGTGGLTLPPQPVQVQGELSATPAPQRRELPGPAPRGVDWNPKAATQVPAQRRAAPASSSQVYLAALAVGSTGLGFATLCLVLVAWFTLSTDEPTPVSGTPSSIPTGLPADAP